MFLTGLNINFKEKKEKWDVKELCENIIRFSYAFFSVFLSTYRTTQSKEKRKNFYNFLPSPYASLICHETWKSQKFSEKNIELSTLSLRRAQFYSICVFLAFFFFYMFLHFSSLPQQRQRHMNVHETHAPCSHSLK